MSCVANIAHACLAVVACLLQLQDERNQVLDKLNLVDMQVTALKSSNADLSAAVEAEQQRCSELEAVVASQDRVSATHTSSRECQMLLQLGATLGRLCCCRCQARR